MTDSELWDRAKLPPRPQSIEIRKREPRDFVRDAERHAGHHD
jgi:hypothetical protein